MASALLISPPSSKPYSHPPSLFDHSKSLSEGSRSFLRFPLRSPRSVASRTSQGEIRRFPCSRREEVSIQKRVDEEEIRDFGVKVALSMLKFYKREISPLLPSSCRYVPTCSEYSMEAYKRFGFVKGTILTAWRICRCNPLGGSGFDPPRWFGEQEPSEQ
uniref:Uncharacterized protein n=1 Tax=Ananas comosus var. bracteatus TaxID=296719 RepID=A0A6V7QT72_ANACO